MSLEDNHPVGPDVPIGLFRSGFRYVLDPMGTSGPTS
jgi:hypothetical protein